MRDGNVSIKEEISEGEEEIHEANPLGTMLAEGQAVAIPIDFFQELELKEEEQWISGGVVEGEGTEQEPILLDDEEDEAEAGNEVVGEEQMDQVITGNESEVVGGDASLRVEEVVKSGYAEEDITAAWLLEAGDESSTDQSLDDYEEDQVAVAASGGTFRQDEGLGFEEVLNSEEGEEIRMELGGDVTAWEGGKTTQQDLRTSGTGLAIRCISCVTYSLLICSKLCQIWSLHPTIGILCLHSAPILQPSTMQFGFKSHLWADSTKLTVYISGSL